MGYIGEYLGVDIVEKFKLGKVKNIQHSFMKINAEDFNLTKKKFTLIISISTLEHIRNDRMVLKKTSPLLTKGGIEIHIVPSGWGLPIYLWHGYRQYSLSRIESLFDFKDIFVVKLGGMFSFFFHLFFITFFEMLLKVNLRKKIPSIYKFFLKISVFFDSFLPICPSAYVIVRENNHN